MKVVATGTYSQAGLAALADATYEQRRAAMDELYSACGGKIIDYFFCDGDADFIAIAEVPSREVNKGMLNNAMATGATVNLREKCKNVFLSGRLPRSMITRQLD